MLSSHDLINTKNTSKPLYEFVPEALRATLRWDDRHDAMAQWVVDEFGLSLPRDRELARQLAFIRVEQGAALFIPFGKYKGQLLEQIFDADQSYLEWLAQQDWFRAEFPTLHAAIVELDAEDVAA